MPLPSRRPAAPSTRRILRRGAVAWVASLLLASSPAAARPADAGTPGAAVLTGVEVEHDDATIRIALRGTGRLEPVDAGQGAGPPARVFVDLLVASTMTAVRGGLGPVRGIRAVEGTPGITRVVIDLDRARAYHLERGRDRIEDLVVVLDAASDVQRAAGPPPVPGERAAAVAPSREANGPRQRWVSMRGLRASVGASYEKTDLRVDDGGRAGYTDRVTSPLASLRATFAVADPGILLVDVSADVRLNFGQYRSDPFRRDTTDSLQNYRLNAIVLAGRGSPLTLYAQRFDSFLDQQQTGPAQGPYSLSQTGRQSSRGFSWDINTRRLPHMALSGFSTVRGDEGSRLGGADSVSKQKRLELRADKNFRRWQYDASYVYDDYRYDYPLLQVSTETGYQFLRASATWTPADGLRLTLGGRYANFVLQRAERGEVARGFGGAGTDAGVTWDIGTHVQVTASHTGSLNENELSVTAPADPGTTAPSATARRRFYFQEFAGRIALTTVSRKSSVAAFVRGTWLDPLSFGLPTLDTLTIGGLELAHTRSLGGFELSAGAEAGAGPVTSSRGDRDVYREVDGHLRVARQFARTGFALTGGARQATSPYFHPVGGRAWYGNLDLTGTLARELRLRATAGRSFLMNDVFVQRGDNHTDTASLGLSGERYDVGADYSEIDATTSGLLVPVFGSEIRPDLLRAQRPDLFGVLWGSHQVLREAHARVIPVRGMELFARGSLNRQDMPATLLSNTFEQRIGQAGVIWGLRQLQLEVGWQYLEYSSIVASSVDRRFYVRLRRDLPLF
jgi:hypothetical protein